MLEINISEFEAGNLDQWRYEWGQHEYRERSKSLQLKAVWKEQQTKLYFPTDEVEKGKEKKSAQYKNVKCKTESDWITDNGHISETKACIPSSTSLDLKGGSSSKAELASVARRDVHSSNISHPFRKKLCE